MVGMSGGVDSSVTALLLKQKGYDVTGVTLRLKPEKYLNLGAQGENNPNKDIVDAKIVADKLGIKHMVADFTDLFEKKVIENFVNEYCNGRTPNPCVVCNKFLKCLITRWSMVLTTLQQVTTLLWNSIRQKAGGF